MKLNIKGFKLTDAGRTKMIGVACKSLNELIQKGKTKLNIPLKSKVSIFLLDGTEVDSEEYFQSLPSQSILLLKQEHESLLTGADLIYNALRHVNVDMIRTAQKVQEFLDENIKEKVRLLAEVINGKGNHDCKIALSNKTDDPDWFLGLETNATTKEAFMFRRSQERVRGYFYKTKSEIKKSPIYTSNSGNKTILDDVFSSFLTTLNKDKYFGCFFDRSSACGALCDNEGYFKCSGVWKTKRCLYNGGKSHIINPYSSREERIVFSTWNLDHCIERTRSVIPALLSATELVVESSDSVINVPYFYSLLFTSNNLRLVHIVCHDKGKHSASCDTNQLTVRVACKEKPSSEIIDRTSAIPCCAK